jgi:hypothetical protein
MGGRRRSAKGVVVLPLPLSALSPIGAGGSYGRSRERATPFDPPEKAAEMGRAGHQRFSGWGLNASRPRTTPKLGRAHCARPPAPHAAARSGPVPGANQARQSRGLRCLQNWPLASCPPWHQAGRREAETSAFGVISRRSRVRDPALQAVASGGSLDPARLRPVRAVERLLQTVAFDLMECFVCNRRMQE